MSTIVSKTGKTAERPAIVVVSGEPAGIGPDICLALAARQTAAQLTLLGDADLLGARARSLGVDITALDIHHIPLRVPSTPGQPDAENAACVLEQIDFAVDGCRSGRFAAMTTAPAHKGVINAAGVPFSGHTEYIAARCGVDRVVMMLAGGGLRVALVTTHLPLAQVAAAVTAERLEGVLRILDSELRDKFAIAAPRILVAGLNPHAGEDGYLGREEIEIITPTLERLRAEGMQLVGPLPADTLFTPKVLAGADAQLAMYHDQGLAVLKYAAFDSGINITLGLPIIRTSVDHGVALDLAGSGRASPHSLFAAVDAAAALARRRR